MSWRDIIRTRPVIPAALGAELEPYPYLSGYGLMQRITRLSTPLPSQVQGLGFRNRQVADVLLATQRKGKPVEALLRVLGLHATALAHYWQPQTWSPLQVGDLFVRQARALRLCPRCALHGYHCTLFQLPSITHCPWHGTPLREACPECGTPLHARFDEHAQLGICRCGHDPFDPVSATVGMWEFPGTQAGTWLEDYLKWALRRRASRWLCVPRSCLLWEHGYAALAAPPPAMQVAAHRHPGELEVFCGAGADPAPRQFWGWSSWGGERPLTLAPLPATMYPRLCEATQEVVALLPKHSKTPFELVDANGLQAQATLRENLLQRPDCFIAPHGRAGSGAWLNLSTVDAGIAAFCGHVLDQAAAHAAVDPSFQDRSLQAARSNAIDHVQGRRHLLSALESILTRAYRQGVTSILRAKLGLSSGIGAPEAWPILELVGQSGRLRGIRLCWTPMEARARRTS